MGILFRHLTIVQLFLWGFKDVAFVDLLTISGGSVVYEELHGELSLNCSSDCSVPTWELQDDILAELQAGHRSSRLTIQDVTTDDGGKYTCKEQCGASTKTTSVKVIVYSLGKMVLHSTPQTPRSGQPFTVTCELRDFYPETVQLLLSHNGIEVKKLDTDGTVMEVTSSNQQKTTNTIYRCEALMELEGKTIRNSTDLLVQPEEPKTTLATSTQQNILSTSPFRPLTPEDDLQNLETKIRETTTDFLHAPTESSTAEGQHKNHVAAGTTAALVRTEQNVLSTPPFATRDDLLYPVTTVTEALVTVSESEEVQTASASGDVPPSVGLYALSTLGAVASIASMGTALFLVLYRKRKRRQEKTEGEEEMEKEKETQQLPEMSP
ncbi:uncharacterized protein LOC134075095 [Sardina pilchardus]|uniref:uncharacterized protein LOC134075095 n=1 Tax=Sardina pilchardus TaxID=27697 RepID=UPI002E0DE392